MRCFKAELGAVGIMVVVGCATLLSVFWGCDETAQEPFTDEATAVVEPDMAAPVPGMPDIDSKPESDPMPPALRAAFIRSRQEEAGPEYAVATHGKLPVVTNGKHKLRAELESDSVRILPMNKDAEWSVDMRLASVERGEESDLVQRATREVEGNRVDYRRGDITEWYLNGPVGFEQGFAIQNKPLDSSDGELRLHVSVDSELEISLIGENGLALKNDAGGVVLRASDLVVLDSYGDALKSRFEIVDGGFVIAVEDADAEYPIEVDPIWIEQQKLLAMDATGGEQFGVSVSVSGDTAVVGAWSDGDLGTQSGSAYVFTRSGTTWTEQQKLLASDGGPWAAFGRSTSIDGDTIVVGAYQHQSAYVFVRSGTTWTEQQKLIPSDGPYIDGFGCSVSICGDTALVGSYTDDDSGVDSGSADVFVRSGISWIEQQKLLATSGGPYDFFGISVSVNGDTALVGAIGDYGTASNSGSAYVFVRSGTTWTQQQNFVASDGAADDKFGFSVSLSGDTALVGAYGDDDNGGWSGSAYVFVRSGTIWTQQQKLLSGDGAASDHFGWSVSLSGDTALVGAYADDDTELDSGSAYVFIRSGTTWTQQGKLTASDGATGDQLGSSVSLSGDTALVGAQFDDDTGPSSGSAYVFELICSSGSDCSSGFCVDGVCCENACGGGLTTDCQACSVAMGSSTDGLCEDLTGTTCDDGMFCDGTEVCSSGVCGSSTGNPCDGPDGDDNCSETCDETSDNCLANDTDGSACDDGSFCNGTETCTTGVCGSSTGDPCTGPDGDGDCAESCDETADNCTGPDITGSSCDDGLFCTVTDACNAAGVCVGTGNPCPGPNGDINCVESCDEVFDNCAGNDVSGSPCNDGLYCTATDTCNGSGSCVGMGDPCPGPDGDGDCVESCQEDAGACSANDPDGSDCDDGDSMTMDDQCTSGVCDGTASDTDTDTDSDTDSDTDTDTDTDTSADAGTGGKDKAGCGCRAVGTGDSAPSLFGLLMAVI